MTLLRCWRGRWRLVSSDALQRARAFAKEEHRLLIAGREVTSAGGEVLQVINPSDESELAVVPQANEMDIDRAVAAARDSFERGTWTSMAPDQKTVVLQRLAELVERNSETLATLESLDNGKAISEARADVRAAAEVLRYYAGWPSKIFGDTNPTESGLFSYSVRDPVGVVAVIVPWNYPLLIAVWKLGPALATGNSVVLKPSEHTPLTALYLGRLCLEAGLPPGVVNVLTGDGRVGRALCSHPAVNKITFTGSTQVGQEIMTLAAANLTRVHLELGGKNSNIIFADADLDRAIEGAFRGAFENGGQACIAGSSLLVERAVYERVVEQLSAQAKKIRVGPGICEDTEIGAIVSDRQLERILDHIRTAVDEGAEVVVGGSRTDHASGYFVQPTVLANVTPLMRIAKEEVFGPVVAVLPFDEEGEAVEIANRTPYGLAGAVWTSNIGRALRVSRSLQCGTVWVNTYGRIRTSVSFGGFKHSGFGKDLGKYSIDEYTQIKSVFVNLTE